MRLVINFMLVVMLMGCTTTEYTNNKQMTKIETGSLTELSSEQKRFAWYPNPKKAFLPANVNRDRVISYTEDAITQILQEKGYTLVPIDQKPDFLVGYGLALESQLSDEEIFEKVGMVVGLSIDGMDKDKFQKGSALVAIYQPNDKDPQWQVLAQGFADTTKTKQSRKDNIYAVMMSMLSTVPPVQ